MAPLFVTAKQHVAVLAPQRQNSPVKNWLFNSVQCLVDLQGLLPELCSVPSPSVVSKTLSLLTVLTVILSSLKKTKACQDALAH